MSDIYIIILFVYNVVDTLMEIVLVILFMCNSSIKTSRLTSPKLSLANRKVMRVVYYRPACGHFEQLSRLPNARQDVEPSKTPLLCGFMYVFYPGVRNIKCIGWRLDCLVQRTRYRKTIANEFWLPICRGVSEPLVQSCNCYILNFRRTQSV